MPVGCNALNSNQLVAGCDFHKQIPPPPPAGPAPMAPHVVVYCIGWASSSTTKASTTVKAGSGYALGRQHDIGMGVYHIAVNALLPLIWAGAANKAEFGCSTIKIDVSGDALRMAVAVIPGAGLNLQLDCNEPCSYPSSLCVASFNTVYGGFSLLDLLAGIAAGICDVAISWAVGKIAGKIVGAAGGAIGNMLGKSATGITVMLGAGIVASKFPIASAIVGQFVKGGAETVVGWVIGTPLGYSFPSPLGLGSTYGGKLNDTVNDLISPSAKPATPTAPSTPSSPTGTSATPSSTGPSSSGGSPPSATPPSSAPPASSPAPAAPPPAAPPSTAPPTTPAPDTPPTGGPPSGPIV